MDRGQSIAQGQIRGCGQAAEIHRPQAAGLLPTNP